MNSQEEVHRLFESAVINRDSTVERPGEPSGFTLLEALRHHLDRDAVIAYMFDRLAIGSPSEQGIALDVLGQLRGVTHGECRRFRAAARRMLDAEDVELRVSANLALHFLWHDGPFEVGEIEGDQRAIVASVRMGGYELRHAVARSLSGGAVLIDEAADLLIELTSDDDVDTRNWALFALREGGVFTAAAQSRYLALMDDPDPEVSLEATLGAAQSGLEHGQLAIAAELEEFDDFVMYVVCEVIEASPAAVYLAPLERRAQWETDIYGQAVASALRACAKFAE